MNKRGPVILSTVVSAVISLVILASIQENSWSSSTTNRGEALLGTPLTCLNASCCPTAPFAYALSLPIGSPITNETELFQSIPAALYVEKYNTLDDTYWRWYGFKCCVASWAKGGRETRCVQATGQGGECFSVNPGDGVYVVANAPSSYNVLGTDGSTAISLARSTPGISRSGTQLISLPYCSPVTTAMQLIQSIENGGPPFSKVQSVGKYLCQSDTIQVYTGRMGSPGQNFNLVPGEAYQVQMAATVAYTTSYAPCTLPPVCPGCGADGTPCNDGNACTTGDQCSNGTCVGTPAQSCEDNDSCTEDFCNGCTGACVHPLKPPCDPCVSPSVAGGTIALPPEGCGYFSPDRLHMLLDGLPPGTEVTVASSHQNFFPVPPLAPALETSTTSTIETFDSDIVMHLTGTGIAAAVNCDLTLTPARVVIESQPAQPGQPVQDFDTDMKSLTGTLTSDTTCNLFQNLSVVAGTDHGLPSPGHVHLEQSINGFNVASFFDVNVTMSFEGKPGSILEGMSGSTTQVVRMGAASTIVGGNVVEVSPQSLSRLVGTDHTVIAIASDFAGHPVAGQAVFSVTSGPNAGAIGTCSVHPSCASDASGRVSFTYTSDGRLGTDHGTACVTTQQGQQCFPWTVTWACTTDGTACDDGNACTTSDVCSTGSCQGLAEAYDVGPTLRMSHGGGTSTIEWSPAAGTTAHDVLRGLVSLLPVGPGAGDESCIAPNVGGATTSDSDSPGSRESFWYVVRSQGACGTGTYGFEGIHGVPGPARSSSTCP